MEMTRRSLIVGGLATVATATARSLFGQRSFRGSYAGQERVIDGVVICWCPPGAFLMGSPPSEPDRRPGEDQVRVTRTRGFWIAKYETTRAQCHRISGDLPGALTTELPAGTSYPVGNVNFAEAETFCRQFTLHSRRLALLPADWEFRLPTEAQWEYACRADSATATAFGNSLSGNYANFSGRQYNGAEPGPALHRAAPVGRYPANAWGIHDMHGNTYEWCRDWYHAKLPGGSDPDLYLARESAARNRDGTISRVRRGGGWPDDGWACRSAARFRFEPERRYDHIGFRIVAVQV